MCQRHRAKHKDLLAALRIARRTLRLCQWGACGEPTGGASYCVPHAEHRRTTRRDVMINARET